VWSSIWCSRLDKPQSRLTCQWPRAELVISLKLEDQSGTSYYLCFFLLRWIQRATCLICLNLIRSEVVCTSTIQHIHLSMQVTVNMDGVHFSCCLP
jgi:hypothetical protein